MEKDEFLNALSKASQVHASASAADNEKTLPPMPEVPLHGFMGDNLLTLIYLSPYEPPHEYKAIRESLKQVCDETMPRPVRAEAALQIGRFVAQRKEPGQLDKFSFHLDHLNAWFEYARDLGSPIGAMACARNQLDAIGMRVKFDLETDPFPRLVPHEGREPKALPRGVVKEWLHAIRLIASAAREQFTDWDSRDFRHCLAAIVNYLSLVPESRPTGMTRRSSPEDTCVWAERLEALSWITPLWNTLLDSMASHAHANNESDDQIQAFRAQQHIVIARVRHEAASRNPRVARCAGWTADQENQTSGRTQSSDQLVVVTSPIPASNDKEDRAILQQYEKLRQPLALVALPSMEQILFIRQQLLAEFPWATQAVNVVMSDLLARKRHGAQRLGMMPILLVGPPGAGKTRFAQKLGELLQTASLVLGLAGMSDVKVLKGLARGWASARPSRVVEFILQTGIPNPLVIMDEVDKTGQHHQGGSPQDALLDLLEPSNASRYQDIYLMASCDLSHCLYVLTSNSVDRLSEPLLSRLRPVYFPKPGPEHASILIEGVTRDLEKSWNLPEGAITLTPAERQALRGLAPREMRFALISILGSVAVASSEQLN